MGARLGVIARLSVALLVALLLVGLRPLWPLTLFWPWPPLLFLSLLLLLVAARPLLERLMRGAMAVPVRAFLGLIMLAGFLSALWANVVVLERVPHVTDSIAYLFQARVFAAGFWTAPAPPCVECFLPHFFYSDGQRLISLFQPGWPAVLGLGVATGLEYLVNPLLGALSLWPLYRIARRGFGEAAARLTVSFWVLSPFYVYMTASFMAHPLSALLSLWVLERALAWRENGHSSALLLAGGLLGLLALVRIYNALLVGLIPATLVVEALIRGDGKPRLLLVRDALAGLLVCALLAGLQLGVNANLTGDPWRFSQDEYFRLTEREPTCHRLGFGPEVGCEREHGELYGFRKGYHLPEALSVTRQRLDSLALNLYGLPWALWLMALPLAGGRLGRTGFASLGMIAVLVGGYLLFYYHGNCYGPRFYYEVAGLMVLFMVLGLLRLDAWLSRVAARLPSLGGLLWLLPVALGLTLTLFTFGWMHPALKKNYTRFRGIDTGLAELVAESQITRAVVLVPGSAVRYGYGLIHHEPLLRGDVLYARHLWDQSVTLMHHFPDRDFYRFEPRRGRLVKLRRHAYEGLLFSEFESKLPLLDLHEGQIMLQDISHLRPEKEEALQLYFRARGPGSWLEVTQDVIENGPHVIEIAALRGPFNADWELRVNGEPVAGRFSGFAPEYGFVLWRSEAPVMLTQGRVVLRIQVVGRDPQARGFGVGLDYLILRRADVPADAPIPRIEDVGYMDGLRLEPIGPDWIPWEKRSKWMLK